LSVRARRPTLEYGTQQVLEQGGRIITVYKGGTNLAACRRSYRTGQWKTDALGQQGCYGREEQPGKGPENSIHMAMVEAIEEIGLVTGDAAETARVLQRCNGERTRSAD
jgi:hypothetical protein